MAFTDKFFDRVEKRTNVDKNMILDLAKKLQQNDLKDEGTLREIIHTLSKATGKDVSKESIDILYERGIKAGALGGKLLGAGGGGFLLFYVKQNS